MATQVVMPKLSPTMEEGQLARWLKKEGEKVSVGEPIAEIDTDKATMEAQALTTGVLRKILVPEGETVPLGAIIAIIGEPDEDISSLVAGAQSNDSGEVPKQEIRESIEAGANGSQTETAGVVAESDDEGTQETIEGKPFEGEAGEKPAAKQDASSAQWNKEPSADQRTDGDGQRSTSGRLLVSPIAARMAADAGINLKSLSGSGPGGRIIKRDIEAAIESGEKGPSADEPKAQAAQAATAKTAAYAPETQTFEGAPAFREASVSTMRATIARRLVSSLGPVPHFFLTTEIEMDRAADLRRQINEFDAELKVSVNDIIIKVAAVALMQHPSVNASFQDKTLRFYERADIGVAVAVEEGLITPVVRGANAKSVGQISREVRELAERARSRKLKPEEYTGATFSISNLGMFGIDEFTAIINPPEGAIMAVGAMQPKPVVLEGEVVVRQMMKVTLSCDHRIIDGATGAKFLQTFKKILENPLSLLI